MSAIRKRALSELGYGFIDPQYLPEGQDEYYLRNQQNRTGIQYRNLTAFEIEVLVRNRNTSSNWSAIQVSDAFNPELVKNCKFYGLVRIGKLESCCLDHHNLTLPVGLYDSTIISCDFGDNVVVNNVSYISHYIVGNEVILYNIHELHTTQKAKFGNGIIKEGEDEAVRVWIEVCNENGGRKILPFNGMLPGDAYLWQRYRDDAVLMERFKEFTEKRFNTKRGYYGKIGDRCVVKNCSIVKDVWIGSDAYIKGANKLKNLTINSSPEAPSQIGEGCELVNGILSFGCRVFYGVKAVRFYMASHSQLKYGARLINSYLGNNSTISCCEVLNSLIYPAHEQHHNNSFLCAALVMGQSNIAAGATIGSNHNSRAADGELQAGRGFWPGLCVSLKHNSRFASYVIVAKGDYPHEVDIPFPFSLVSLDESANELLIMPGYWWMYNLYALARNASKSAQRDKRTKRIQQIAYDFLAPDTVNEIFAAIPRLEALIQKSGNQMEVATTGNFENSKRTIRILKAAGAVEAYGDMVRYYGAKALLDALNRGRFGTLAEAAEFVASAPARGEWCNIGGQLLPCDTVDAFLENIRTGKVASWEAVHRFYREAGNRYDEMQLSHAAASLLETTGMEASEVNESTVEQWLESLLETKRKMVKSIRDVRAKDYVNPFRTMVYDSEAQMESVLGPLDENAFILEEEAALQTMQASIHSLLGLHRKAPALQT